MLFRVYLLFVFFVLKIGGTLYFNKKKVLALFFVDIYVTPFVQYDTHAEKADTDTLQCMSGSPGMTKK